MFTFSRNVYLAHIFSSVITDGGFVNSCCLQWKLEKKQCNIGNADLSILNTPWGQRWGKNKNIVFSATMCSYLFNWQFTDSWSQVRFYIRDDFRVFSKPVKHWFLLQVSNLLKSIKIAYYYFRKTGSEVLLSHTHFIFYTIHRTMQIQMTSDVLYIKSCLCGSLGRSRDVDEAFERQRKQMPAANGLKWKTNLLNVNTLVLLFSEYKNNTNRRKW